MKRMTAEILSHQWNTTSKITSLWLQPEAGTFITIRCPVTRKKKTFEYGSKYPHSIFRGLSNGDIIEFDYTEQSFWLSKLFRYPEMHNIIAKVKDKELERILDITPKTGTNVGATMLDRFVVGVAGAGDKGELKLKGSLKDIIKFVYYTIQNVEDFSFIDPHPGSVAKWINGSHYEFKHDIYLECSFKHVMRHKKDYNNSSTVGIVFEPVDSMNVIVHVAVKRDTDNPSISPQTLISRIIDKLSQANRQ